MKRIIFITTFFISCFLLASLSTAAKSKDISQFEKMAKKEAKRLNKEGWKTDSYGPSLKDLLINYREMMMEFDEDGNPKYVTESSRGVGSSYEEARNLAIIAAKKGLANAGWVEVNTITDVKTIQESMTVTTSEISYSSSVVDIELELIPIMELYRKLDKHSYEVHIVFGFHRSVIDNVVKDRAIKREKLTKYLDELWESL